MLGQRFFHLSTGIPTFQIFLNKSPERSLLLTTKAFFDLTFADIRMRGQKSVGFRVI
jgi:hypothetical protein